MRRKRMPLVPILALVATAIPTAAWATHEVTDERPATPLEDFRAAMGSWIDPWVDISGTSIADDHAPWVALGLYEELLGINPEPCYLDTYAAYWAVAADIRAMGQAPNREQQEAEIERVFEDVARAEALAQDDEVAAIDEGGCRSAQAEAVGTPDPEANVDLDRPTGDQTRSPRVIDIEATAALQFTDERGNKLSRIAVTPGETVVFRLHNTAGFLHSFYIGSEQELAEPAGATDVGVAGWTDGVRELEWTVPYDVSGLMYGCTVPGHFPSMHGTFSVAPPSDDAATGAGASPASSQRPE